MELETVNKLYLELSQVATATTARERALTMELAEVKAQRDDLIADHAKADKYPKELRDCVSALRVLFDRDCRVVGNVLELPCGNHDQAFNFMTEAREIYKRADALLAAQQNRGKGQ